jgi:hypothetical protein
MTATFDHMVEALGVIRASLHDTGTVHAAHDALHRAQESEQPEVAFRGLVAALASVAAEAFERYARTVGVDVEELLDALYLSNMTRAVGESDQ